jgi:hypothetical protein
MHKENLDDNIMVFGRVFWSFETCIEGFTYYRPLINVDGTYLYGRYDEKLLIVIVFMQIIGYSCF